MLYKTIGKKNCKKYSFFYTIYDKISSLTAREKNTSRKSFK
ncbi:hypothetical protein EUBDOL_01408 [Amedibacillus dolichus DSM 3991]|uniref:Uncharacterized protein n=1 Tax=Amedibacillus dolichus DSM 3991 TaxID=428127 RepID=A8RCI8_9FIRM|nr:hypothetical protein EUBDOL_01408 [Amedibacillus dolichus DSM 3991]